MKCIIFHQKTHRPQGNKLDGRKPSVAGRSGECLVCLVCLVCRVCVLRVLSVLCVLCCVWCAYCVLCVMLDVLCVLCVAWCLAIPMLEEHLFEVGRWRAAPEFFDEI